MMDPDTDAELTVVHASFHDPYLLIIRNDRSAIVLKTDKKGEIEEIDGGKQFNTKIWISGCIHAVDSDHPNAKSLLYLLSATGGLHVSQAILV